MVRAPLHFHGRIPVPEVAPLTYRDGVSQLELVYELSQYLKKILHPSLQSTVDQVVADAEQMIDEANSQYVDGVEEFQRIHDAFMSDVQASLTALNDTAASDLVEDRTSNLSRSIQSLYREEIVTHVSQFGAVGDGEHDDTQAILDAIDHAGDGPIALMEGGYHRITQTIPVHKIQGNGATLYVDANVDGIAITPHSRASNFTVEVIYPGVYSRAGMRLDTQAGWNVAATATLYDIHLLGKTWRTIGEPRLEGKGIAAEDGPDESVRSVITYLKTDGLVLRNWEYGLYVRAERSNSWFNGNQFDMRMYDMRVYAYLSGIIDNNKISGQWQTTARTTNMVQCSGDSNDFSQVVMWDIGSYPDVVTYEFEIDGQPGSYNVLPSVQGTPLESYGTLPHYGNTSNRPRNIPWSGIVLPQPKETSAFQNRRATTQYVLENMLGNQDDILKMAHKNHTVTTNYGSGTTSSPFTFRGSPARYQITPSEPLRITIDINGSLSFVNVLGVLFAHGNPADHVTISTTNTSGSTVERLSQHNVRNSTVAHVGRIAGSVASITFTFRVDEPKTVYIASIFGAASWSPQAAFIQTDGATTMWGNIRFGEHRLGPILTSADGSQHLLRVENDGSIYTTRA